MVKAVKHLILAWPGSVSEHCLRSFVASNWQSGWVGALLLDVFYSMGLQDEHIEAMTQLNFSGATDPHNSVSS